MSSEIKVEVMMSEVMLDTGASITISNDLIIKWEIYIKLPASLTNVLAFAIGILTPTPEIQIFSIGNAAAITIDYIYEAAFRNYTYN